jgi:hypothetical protein
MSVWEYSCKKGLAQDTCGQRKVDKKARGYGQWGGCPSCAHREPANAETTRADNYHASS